MQAEQAQHGVRRAAEHPDDRGAEAGHALDPGGDEDGDALRVAQRGLLGDEFADDEGEIGGQHDDDDEGERAGERREHGDGVQPVFKMLGDARAAEHAGQHADEGDADLHRGEEALRVLGQGQRDGGAADALALEHGQSRPAEGDECQLAHREDAVDQDQQQDDDDFQAQIHSHLVSAGCRCAKLGSTSGSGNCAKFGCGIEPSHEPKIAVDCHAARDRGADPVRGVWAWRAGQPAAERRVVADGADRVRGGDPGLPGRGTLGFRALVEAGVAPTGIQRARFGMGVLPSLFGWVAVLVAVVGYSRVALAMLAVSFLVTTVVEARALRHGAIPRGYMGLRWVLSAVVLVVLVTVWFVLMLHGRVVL